MLWDLGFAAHTQGDLVVKSRFGADIELRPESGETVLQTRTRLDAPLDVASHNLINVASVSGVPGGAILMDSRTQFNDDIDINSQNM